MRLIDARLRLTATDLSNFLGCRVRTALEMAEANGGAKRPYFDDPLREILFQRGVDHEKAYVASLREAGRRIVEIEETTNAEAALAATAEAMRGGADVIVQAALRDAHWYGRADILDKVAAPSALGTWSYEIVDTKLARETRAGTILQLGLYSAMLETAQGARPEFFHVVTPGPVHHSYRVDAHAAYFRWIRQRMEDMVASGYEAVAGAFYPEPVEHCDICPWHSGCNARWHDDDHLSIVAGITRHQRHELAGREVGTLAALARLPVPLDFKPKRGSADTYVRVREQARLQFESRGRLWPLHELRPFEDGKGLARLPEPSPGDIFLDLEGDSFAREGGREYLFGLVTAGPGGAPDYRGYWAFDDAEERAVFENVMDVIVAASAAHPGMHVYHYAPYEPSAFKRLMGRYATRGDALDVMLREGRFVDLYGVVRQGLLAGIERYSIKNLEVLYGYERDVTLRDAGRALRRMEQALELSCPDAAPREVRDLVEGYNRDDCVSTLRLRDWLEKQRAALEASGTPVPRPVVTSGAPPEKVDERARRVATLRERLLAGIPEDAAKRDDEQRARWKLAYLLDWHRREDKAGWWEYYRLRDLPEEDLFDEPQAVAGLQRIERIREVTNAKTGKSTGSVVDRYRYPAQDMEIRGEDELKLKDGKKYADVCRVDRKAMTIDIQKGKTKADIHATAAFVHNHVNTGVLEEAIDRIAHTIATAGRVSAEDDGEERLAGALLLAAPPRLRTAAFAMDPDENAVDFAVRAVVDLDRTVLAIQGPPGSGKTYSGARMICALIAAGRTVGVTATGHKVIRNLLEAVAREARKCGAGVHLAQKTDDDDPSAAAAGITIHGDNPEALIALQSGAANVLGGTAWLWARPEFAGAVDVLFVDEAGQMSLANVLAVSRAASSIVLLGDPQQLDQPQKGTHPEGVGASALEHILGGQRTISPDRGVFLPETWRLAPSVCAFTSEVFYDGKLRSTPGLEAQQLRGNGEFEGSGLWFVDVVHDGNRNFSVEEVDRVAALVAALTASGSLWVDRDGVAAQMKGEDILVVSPYNAQVVRLVERLEGTGAQVGTVDKFQGREAPVVIYSMATSRPEDAPRGMEFLYSLNRLNVATSRARCAAIVVASPLLVEPECRTPRQMELANALCRFREMARR